MIKRKKNSEKEVDTVSVEPVTPEESVKVVEEEVPQEVIEAQVRSFMPEDSRAANLNKMREVIGAPLSVAEDMLKAMKESKAISSYRVVPIGMPTTLDLEPGRVTVVVDGTKMVLDISLS